VRGVIILLAAMASVGLLGTLGTGDGLVRENQGANAQTVSPPNIVFTTGAKDVAGNQLDQNTTTAGAQEKAWSFTESP
jgi:hypothetical protein